MSRGIEVLPEESPVMDELPSKDEIEEEVQVIEAQDNLRFKNPKLSAAAYGDFLHRLLEELDFRTADISNPEREDVLIPFVKIVFFPMRLRQKFQQEPLQQMKVRA